MTDAGEPDLHWSFGPIDDEPDDPWDGVPLTPPRWPRLVAWVLIIAIVATAVLVVTAARSPSSSTTLSSFPLAYGAPTDTHAIATRVARSLVTVTTYNADGMVHGYATGMVLSATGTILTNNHVVDGASRLVVRDVGNGHSYTATVVGYDTAEDVAVIRAVGARGLATVTIPTSPPIYHELGVVTVGNAQDSLHYSGGWVIAQGVDTLVGPLPHFAYERLTDIIESNAQIAPGDSGGALVNARGDVIGMLTAAPQASQKSYDDADPSAPSYSISVDAISPIVSAILAGQASPIVHIGPTTTIGITFVVRHGALVVSSVTSASDAWRDGVRAGDVLTALNGAADPSATSALTDLDELTPGASVFLSFANGVIAHVPATNVTPR